MKAISLAMIASIFFIGIFIFSISILQIFEELNRRRSGVMKDGESLETKFFKYWTLLSIFVVGMAIYLLPITLGSITKKFFWFAMIILIL